MESGHVTIKQTGMNDWDNYRNLQGTCWENPTPQRNSRDSENINKISGYVHISYMIGAGLSKVNENCAVQMPRMSSLCASGK